MNAGLVRVTANDGSETGSGRIEVEGAQVMQNVEQHAIHLDHAAGGQALYPAAVIDVATNSGDRGDALQRRQDFRRANVAGVDDLADALQGSEGLWGAWACVSEMRPIIEEEWTLLLFRDSMYKRTQLFAIGPPLRPRVLKTLRVGMGHVWLDQGATHAPARRRDHQCPAGTVYEYLTDPHQVSECAPGVELVEVTIPGKTFRGTVPSALAP